MKLPRLVSFVMFPVFASTVPGLRASGDFHTWTPTPPMGWNSWDSFGTTITEAQTKAQADVMARDLKAHGWQYIVVDIQWYEPGATSHAYRQDAVLTMDAYGRLQPAVNRFPSSAEGVGFTELAAYVHDKGLKFGLHLMRGIPRQAVERNLLVKGTEFHARDIADTNSICPWNPDMYGVDMTKPGAQAYYDSVFAMFAEWGVDYVKVDDIARPYHEHEDEIEAIRTAIDKTGRPIVLSLSPGATALSAAEHAHAHANLWRISDDFWDRWLAIRAQFDRLAAWSELRQPGSWPDADMLPLGVLVMGERRTRLTQDEQITLMTLWSVARSPLMMGGDLTRLDPFTLFLLTNDEVLAVNQHSVGNRPLFDRDGLIGWVAEAPGTSDRYLALFNTRDRVPVDAEEAAYASEWLSSESDHPVEVDVAITGAEQLFLAVDGKPGDPDGNLAVWSDAVLHFADGSSAPLSRFRWTKADALWDSTKWHQREGGAATDLEALTPMRVAFALSSDVTHFTARGMVANWVGSGARFIVAVDTPETRGPALGLTIPVDLSEFGFEGPVAIRDLWTHRDLGAFTDEFAPLIPYHGAALYRLSAVRDD